MGKTEGQLKDKWVVRTRSQLRDGRVKFFSDIGDTTCLGSLCVGSRNWNDRPVIDRHPGSEGESVHISGHTTDRTSSPKDNISILM